MKIRRLLALLAATALLGAVAVGQPIAHAAGETAYAVEVGHDLSFVPQSGGVASESMRFMAPEMNVHKGDTITFQGFFHTATALPVGEDPDEWIATNMALLAPYSLAQPDDEGSTSLKFNDADVFPTGGFTCGIGTAPACEYDGTDVVNSGLLFISTTADPDTGALTGGYTMTINANPGESFYLICFLHPNMRLKVNVIQTSENGTTQGDIDTYSQTTSLQDANTVKAIDANYSGLHQSRKIKNGHRLWQAWVGVDYGEVGGGVTVFDIYPDKLNLRKGDKVKYNFDQNLFEIHSATSPPSQAYRLAGEFFSFQCDPDGSGSAADTPANPDGTCPAGTQLEIDSTAEALATIGDGKKTSASDFESAGVRGPFLPAGITQQQNPWTETFTKPTGKKPAKYVCLVHPNMVNKVVVKR